MAAIVVMEEMRNAPTSKCVPSIPALGQIVCFYHYTYTYVHIYPRLLIREIFLASILIRVFVKRVLFFHYGAIDCR